MWLFRTLLYMISKSASTPALRGCCALSTAHWSNGVHPEGEVRDLRESLREVVFLAGLESQPCSEGLLRLLTVVTAYGFRLQSSATLFLPQPASPPHPGPSPYGTHSRQVPGSVQVCSWGVWRLTVPTLPSRTPFHPRLGLS